MKWLPIVLCALLPAGDAAATRAPTIAASIKPLHSLVQGVVGDTAKTMLLMPKAASPHALTLKPSRVRALHQAGIIFYIDDELETFLPGVLETLPASVRKIAVAERARLPLLERREGGAWETHGHEDHAHENEGRPRHSRRDLHAWLDADNAKKITAAVAEALTAAYPENRRVHERNARALTARIEAVDNRLREKLAGVKNKPFIVFHDAYQYFERRYGLTGAGSITLEPHEPPSISRVREIRGKIEEAGVVCIFSEPQFSDRLVNTVAQGSGVRRGMLDPLGAELEPGAALYFKLLENLAESFKRCLAP